MLIRLILFMAIVGGLGALFTWWRAQARALPSGAARLGLGEFEQLRKLAKKYPRLEQAIQLRINVVQLADDDNKAELSNKVDAALRRIGEQLTLRERIVETLAQLDRDRLAREAAGAQAQAASAEPDDPVHGLATQLGVQLEQVDRLATRQKDLDAAADRIVLLLRNLNLALLEAKSSRAGSDGDRVRTVLADLEDAGETLRQTTEAEAEVARILGASQNRISA